MQNFVAITFIINIEKWNFHHIWIMMEKLLVKSVAVSLQKNNTYH